MNQSVEYYLSRGLDSRYAEYFASGRRKILTVEPKPDFTLVLSFDNGEKRQFDMKPILQPNTVFEPFMVYDNFQRVYLDEDASVSWDIDPNVDSRIVWNNKVDICPDTCYLESTPVV